MTCPRCSGDMYPIAGDYPTGVVAPDGGREVRYQEGFQCEKCGTIVDADDLEDETCEASECDKPRKPGDTLCVDDAAVRDDARATYRRPYSQAEVRNAYSDPSERAKREALR